ncbi:MAG: hypothetical protein IJJ26_06355 [Victivallales bacterium]|nr:hypothetical protein [Victivallales bacterium]
MKHILLMAAFILSLGNLKAEEVSVGIACSSACESYGNTDPKLIFGWGETISEFLAPNVKVLNFAKAGASTSSFRENKHWDKLLAAKPTYALLALGANDTPPKKHSNTIDQFKENLRQFVADCNANGIQPIFVTLNQSMVWNKDKTEMVFRPKSAPVRKDRVPYSQAIREVAAEQKLPCLELFDTQSKYMAKLGEERCRTFYRYNPETEKMDPSHTNREGARFVASIIAELLSQAQTPLAEFALREKVLAFQKELGLK